MRLSSYRREPTETCPNPECLNHQTTSLSAGTKFYFVHGYTTSGAKRRQCRACGTTFVTDRTFPRKGPNLLSHKNKRIFKLLLDKMPMRRICNHEGISPRVLYEKIDFLFERCLSFVTARERPLREGMELKRLYLAVDQQDLAINWPTRDIRKNIQLKAAAVADNDTMYVFGSFLNYDPALDPWKVEGDAAKIGDNEKPPPFRKYARVWLLEDYINKLTKKKDLIRPKKIRELRARIIAAYERSEMQDDVESGEFPTDDRQLPHRGVQIHNEYTFYAIFLYLREYFQNVEKLRFFLDRDSGLRAACLAAFWQEILEKRCDVFFVAINTGLTIDQKEAKVDACYKQFYKLKALNPDKKDFEIKLLMLYDEFERLETMGGYKDRWLNHPMTTMAEPEKRSCHLTDLGQYDNDLDHLLLLHNKVSLKAVDEYFMTLRRSISVFERPIDSASSQGRTWYGYSPYSAEGMIKLLNIYRTYYNYARRGVDGQTPAMRIGLAKGAVRLEDIIYGRKFSGYTFAEKAARDKQKKYEDEKKRREKALSTKASRRRYRTILRNTNHREVIFISAITDGEPPDQKIVEIAIADNTGRVFFKTFVFPGRPVSKETTTEHGITDRMVSGKPVIADLEDALVGALADKVVVGFDVEFNARLFPERVIGCASRYVSFREAQRILLKSTLSIQKAAKAIGYTWSEGWSHRALPEALAIRALWNNLAKWNPQPVAEPEVTPKRRKRKSVAPSAETQPVEPKQAETLQSPPQPIEMPRDGIVEAPSKPPEEPKPGVEPPRQYDAKGTVFLDTETTGLNSDDEIIEIAIISEDGQILIDSLVRPSCPVKPDAFRVHGISTDMLANAPTLAEVEPSIIAALESMHVVMYNKEFDLQHLTPAMRAVISGTSCCMTEFAAFRGRGTHGFMKNLGFTTLDLAAGYVGHVWVGKRHRALGDVFACRAVWQHMSRATRSRRAIYKLKDIY